jgi:hypothetical protein
MLFPSRLRRLLRALAPLLLCELRRPCLAALQSALPPQCNGGRVFTGIGPRFVRLVACGLDDVLHDPERERGGIGGLRFAGFLRHAWHYANLAVQLQERSRILRGSETC